MTYENLRRKAEDAREMLRQGIRVEEIRTRLREKYGSGLSTATLARLRWQLSMHDAETKPWQ